MMLSRRSSEEKDCVVSLSLHDGNETTSPIMARFCSSDERRQQPASLNFTSTGPRLTVWLRGRARSPASTTATQPPPPSRRLPPRMSFVAAFAFVDSSSVPPPPSPLSPSSVSTSSERPYADSRLQIHSANDDNISKSTHRVLYTLCPRKTIT